MRCACYENKKADETCNGSPDSYPTGKNRHRTLSADSVRRA